MTEHDDTELDAALGALKRTQTEPSDALMARVLGDADGVQTQLTTTIAADVPQPKTRGWFSEIFDGFGMAGGLALAASAAIGLFAGAYAPFTTMDTYLADSDWAETVAMVEADFSLLEVGE